MVRSEDKALILANELILLSKNEWWRLLRSYLLRDYIGAVRSFELVVEYLVKVIHCSTNQKNTIKHIGHDITNLPRELEYSARKKYDRKSNGKEMYDQDTKRIIELTLESQNTDNDKCVSKINDIEELMNTYNLEIGSKDKHTEKYYTLFSPTPDEIKIKEILDTLRKDTNELKIIHKKKIYATTDEEIINFLKYSDGKFSEKYRTYGKDSLIVRQYIKKFRDESLYNQELLAGFYYNYTALFIGKKVSEMLLSESTLSQPHQHSSRYPDPDNPHITSPLNVYTRKHILIKNLPQLIRYTKISISYTQLYYDSIKKVYEMERNSKKNIRKKQ